MWLRICKIMLSVSDEWFGERRIFGMYFKFCQKRMRSAKVFQKALSKVKENDSFSERNYKKCDNDFSWLLHEYHASIGLPTAAWSLTEDWIFSYGSITLPLCISDGSHGVNTILRMSDNFLFWKRRTVAKYRNGPFISCTSISESPEGPWSWTWSAFLYLKTCDVELAPIHWVSSTDMISSEKREIWFGEKIPLHFCFVE